MKKIISILIILISTTLSPSDLDGKRRPFFIPRTPRLCHKQRSFERNSGFDTAYRKKIGNQYLEEMITNIKKEAEAVYHANSARLQKQNITQKDNFTQTVLKIPHSPRLPIKPKETSPSYTHLRTPKNAAEIQDLITISTMLPEIFHKPKFTQFDAQPDHYFYRN